MNKETIYKFIGVLDKDKEFIFKNVDIGSIQSEYCYKYYFLLGLKRIHINGVYIKVVKIDEFNNKFLFFGEKNNNGVIEIYEFNENYESKLTHKYNKSYALNRNDEENLKNYFHFLNDEYGFKFAKNSLGNAIDKNGNFFFYGPVYCYSMYNDDVCINILNLVQRQDYEIFITREYNPNQVYIRNGIAGDSHEAYNFRLFAAHTKQSLDTTGEIYGFKVEKRKIISNIWRR